jgi:hypothetical protein
MKKAANRLDIGDIASNCQNLLRVPQLALAAGPNQL